MEYLTCKDRNDQNMFFWLFVNYSLKNECGVVMQCICMYRPESTREDDYVIKKERNRIYPLTVWIVRYHVASIVFIHSRILR